MLRKFRFIFIGLILFTYALLYMATTKKEICGDECERVIKLDSIMRADHHYINYVTACRYPINKPGDSLCVFVKTDTGINIDWLLVADTVCTTSASIGIVSPSLFIISGRPPYDTLAHKVCP